MHKEQESGNMRERCYYRNKILSKIQSESMLSACPDCANVILMMSIPDKNFWIFSSEYFNYDGSLEEI